MNQESKYYAYDIETFPNVFSCVIQNIDTGDVRVFEVSSSKNDAIKFYKTLQWLSTSKKILVGYNNLGFDYPVLKYFISLYSQNLDGETLANKLYKYANDLIKDRSTVSNIKSHIHISQLDLMKLHHFDNKAKMVSLKILEFNMRSQNIEDLPFKPGTTIEENQIDTLIKYNIHDVNETVKFFHYSRDAIKFREELSIKYKENMLNYSDMKIGKQFFIRNLEEKLGKDICFKDGKPRQTIRNYIDFSKIIFDCVQFKTQKFIELKEYLLKQYTNDMKSVFKNLEVRYKDFVFYLGTGGLHGSVESCYYEADDEYLIYDVDVASYYPSIVVQNKLHPEHLGEQFAHIYNEIRELRFSYPKGTPENKMLKLALNAAGFGDTNNQYSLFYDSQMTITITTNGQLMLCMLAESLMVDIESLRLIQANTDGLTVRFKKESQVKFFSLLKQWEDATGMELEKIQYDSMWIRDVNNYIAKTIEGKVKKIGAYKDKLEWYQNHSALVVPKAVEAYLIDGISLEEFINNHSEPYDFMISFKAPRDSKLVLESIVGLKKEYESLQNTVRYYISKDGKALKKVMPPIKGNDQERIIGINVGYYIDICNDASKFTFENLNYEWYIKEAQKLIDPIFQSKQKDLFDFIYSTFGAKI
ncbi:MAG: hypothetical protein U9Q33_07665 [Campylobacterota bacterium]|nr:hypothetical protein [Campylobacterota bacterium]